jgi:hypothetical protein
VSFVGRFAGEAGEDEVKRHYFPVTLSHKAHEARDGVFAEAQTQNRVAREHRALEALEPHPLRGKSVRCNQIAADRYAHDGMSSSTATGGRYVLREKMPESGI